MIGQTFGHYQILEKLGEGGMGVVYLAEDTTLDRQVAIKVLPESLASEPERIARFEREAKTLAALNHPNIAQIHGFEKSVGVHALVMELVEGPTLADRIAQGAIPVDEALLVAKQIAEALEAAHEAGIIHRDLKPANIKLRPDGVVKVLDFGLAKAMEPAAGTSQNVSQSPTLSMQATQAGIILGTAAYMSPEQAKGYPIDKRTDIWAFGCVLTEMLTGRAAFPGESMSDVLASVLKTEPDWKGLPANLNPRLREALERCLEKDGRKRWHDIADVRLDLEKILVSPMSSLPKGSERAGSTRRGVFVGALGTAVIAVALLLWLRPEPNASPVSHLQMTIPAGVKLKFYNPPIAVSPDGRRVVYAATSGSKTQLYVRDLDQPDAQPIQGTDDANNPFFSPDGQWLGFVVQNAIHKIRLAGGERQLVCQCLANERGVSWGPNETIVYSPRVSLSGIWQVSADGGQEVPLTTPAAGEAGHRWPQLLDDGQLLLYTVGDETEWDISRIVAQRLGTDDPPVTLVEAATYGRYLATGHLIYFRGETLMARLLDLKHLETGPEIRMIEGVSQHSSSGAPLAAFSDSGSLVYVEKSIGDLLQSGAPTWIDAETGEPEQFGPYRSYVFHDLSPDGRMAALQIRGPTGGIFLYNIETGNLSPFLTRPQRGGMPLWVGNDRMAFTDAASGGSLSWQSIDFTGGAQSLSTSPNLIATSVSRDGRWLTYTERDLDTATDDIWVMEILKDSTPGDATAFVQTPDFEGGGQFSPDGEWMAYTSDSSNEYEVHVMKFPEGGQPRQVSFEGGQQPVWGPDGTELFYLKNDSRDSRSTLMSVRIRLDPTFELEGAPMERFDFGVINQVAPPLRSMYSMAPDGLRFMVIQQRESSAEPTPIVVILNWFEELKRLAPRSGN